MLLFLISVPPLEAGPAAAAGVRLKQEPLFLLTLFITRDFSHRHQHSVQNARNTHWGQGADQWWNICWTVLAEHWWGSLRCRMSSACSGDVKSYNVRKKVAKRRERGEFIAQDAPRLHVHSELQLSAVHLNQGWVLTTSRKNSTKTKKVSRENAVCHQCFPECSHCKNRTWAASPVLSFGCKTVCVQVWVYILNVEAWFSLNSFP